MLLHTNAVARHWCVAFRSAPICEITRQRELQGSSHIQFTVLTSNLMVNERSVLNFVTEQFCPSQGATSDVFKA
jgi:hypothetical protein